jgi:hypothetical protein
MNRMSRAGRKLFIRSILRMEWRKNKKAYFTVGQIARKMGLKSSTYLKNVLREMSDTNPEIIHMQQGGMDMWRFQELQQLEFWQRGITINGMLVAVNDYYDRVQGVSE